MLNHLLSSGSTFDTSKTILWQWLNQNANVVKTLALKDLSIYIDKGFVSGWYIELNNSNQCFNLHVLIDSDFPYSPIRIAFKNAEKFLEWPHVEPFGLLCLPSTDIKDIKFQIHMCLSNAIELIEKCQNDKQFVNKEFKNEFISYWNHSNNYKKVESLLDINDLSSRLIFVWSDGQSKLVGDNIEEIKLWVENSGKKFDRSKITKGVFGLLDTPLTPPFPIEPRAIINYLDKNSDNIIYFLAKIPINQTALIILGANTENSRIGLIAVEFSAQSLKGFRKDKLYNDGINLRLRKERGSIKRRDVQRIDYKWVNGRDLNMSIECLKNSRILILGCGSLGSHVAMRLAQSGVGKIVLLDPENLEPANVGRHALGFDSVNNSKSYELELLIRRKYPYIQEVKGYKSTWQKKYDEDPSLFSDNDLILSCMGEWAAEGPLSDWQDSCDVSHPVIYGWLDENGTASHAVAVIDKNISLKCILNEEGRLRNPETEWKNNGLMQTEPACGTLFQPYGPLDVSHAETLVTRLAIDVLTNKTTKSTHQVYACSTSKIKEVDGEWGEEHLKYRPLGFDGAFEYEKSSLSKCGLCCECNKV